ncbi:splicing arginine serine-rich 4, putative [Ichthyophthirius multifiliis]|uniref:Splicing arginine serine-rich 4, putative n=1 Tax=Ichthyophthirius multifiliis TaxID=5932 RepID=G0QPC8_ICHMU|nr:splicing arginine serine-rich 4, putative [Ichthyophthirius multifiliis]EGR32928.1 splicing arginine serine-rich 4, putative [Ichthyophthirius multifiliis]|eukprot:XP_004036914.1 splicing arginine serine-rich 4, putative [Ichthyophthirius multifiliis]
MSHSNSRNKEKEKDKDKDEKKNCKLFIGNLSKDADKRDLENIFKKYGTVKEIKIKATGSNHYGFIEFQDHRDAKDALDDCNNMEFKGKQIRLEFGHGGKRRRENCFNCGYSNHATKDCTRSRRDSYDRHRHGSYRDRRDYKQRSRSNDRRRRSSRSGSYRRRRNSKSLERYKRRHSRSESKNYRRTRNSRSYEKISKYRNRSQDRKRYSKSLDRKSRSKSNDRQDTRKIRKIAANFLEKEKQQ